MITRRWVESLVILALVAACSLAAPPSAARHEIAFPDVSGCQVLACDFHMHTVFSDGDVWPTVRVAEAWREGLDAMAITDHVEYSPHKLDIPPKAGRAYELAEPAAKAAGLLFVRGAEITRDTPPGHFNCLFFKDIKPLDTKKPGQPDAADNFQSFLEAIKRANAQEAFVFWNHQGWQGDEAGRWLDLHVAMCREGLFQGMEIANGDEYYPEAHKACLEKKLTMMANSDEHAPSLRLRSTSQDHRTMTLVLVRQRTLDGLKEALKAGRTVVWYNEQLIGREEFLRPLFNACVQVSKPNVRSKSSVTVVVANGGPADVRLVRPGKAGPVTLVLPARTKTLLRLAVGKDKRLETKYTAANFLVAPGTPMEVNLEVPGL